jgi:NAD(P)-dependent dehydrogenase (short-subunit alcohol dehydrogenase family)
MQVALVTGASRGVGRGVATSLNEAGFKVFATGRNIVTAHLDDAIVRIACDHLRDEQTASVFAQIASEAGRLDVLVNSAWGGYERMVENGAFTWPLPFWEQPAHRWTSMMEAAKGGSLDVSNSESPVFVGRVITALAHETTVLERTGRVLVAATVASEYRIKDIDGKQPMPLTLENA